MEALWPSIAGYVIKYVEGEERVEMVSILEQSDMVTPTNVYHCICL